MHRRYSLIFAAILVALLTQVSLAVEPPPAPIPWSPSPRGAMFRSMLLPGWGQAYNKRPLKAVIVGGLEEGLIYGVYRQHQLFMDERRLGDEPQARAYREDRNRMTWMLAGVLIFSMADAYVDAHLYNFDVSDKLSCGSGFNFSGVAVNIGWIWR